VCCARCACRPARAAATEAAQLRAASTLAQLKGTDMATKKKGRKYGKGAQRKVAKVMRERKHGTLKSGRSGKKVKSRKQAIAIGLSEARRSGAKVPKKRGGKRKKSSKRKSSKRKKSS
jgi:hypothetical protein